MKIEKARKILNEIAEELEGTVRESYSGRGMFGRTCMGIVCYSHIRCIELAGKKGLKGASYDNMGLQYIVYWRELDTTKKEEAVK